ncbi:TonB-dependent receptor [Pedobacter gandavensis]|uniref:TonB-dependent receptor n=1 Tax=Pedobacter gandavensis TaxID=2679963 RepID=UPI00292F5C79|nr:TonB-dependent receptor [Pedobacter gandavensis]
MYKYVIYLGLLSPLGTLAQTIKGKVVDENQQPIPRATIVWLQEKKGVTTNATGQFSIDKLPGNHKLVASHSGYQKDTIELGNTDTVLFILKEKNNLKEVRVTAGKAGTLLSNLSPVKTEILTSTELKKAACCDLAGCFETQSTVQPQTTNVITNAKELRILGLSGVYNQVLIDGFPMIQGLTFTYGISGIPGTLVENIHISKGANSVLQGYESISGQINVETKKPNPSEKLFANIYVNSFLEKHLNLNTSFKAGKWKSLLAFHTVQPAKKTDRDNDNFLDLPLLTRYMVLNKWKLGLEKDWGWSAEFALRYLHENRVGGQTFFDADRDKGSDTVYGNTVSLNQPEMWAKTSYRFNDIHRVSVYTSAFHQNQSSYFGALSYKAKQSNAFVNLQYELSNTENHTLKTGISFKSLNLKEDILFTSTIIPRTYDGNYRRNENVAGVFAENMLTFLDGKLTWIAGIRADHHNKFGWYATPRTLLKYDPTSTLTLRGNIGTGWRTVNFFSENIGLLASSRDILFLEELKPEKALNMGVNVTQKFEFGAISGHISMDYYRTNFQNQIFPDYDTDPTKAFVRNFTGKSVSNGFQTDLFMKLFKRYEFKAGYNFLDVYRMNNGVKEVLPFNARHKVLTAFSYKPLTNKFHADVNVHWFGKQRLPDTKLNPVPYQRPDYSENYTTVNGQFTYVFKAFEIYTGCENIFNFRQHQPILSWQNPFGPQFDTSSVWGPTRGREFYFGVRFSLI